MASSMIPVTAAIVLPVYMRMLALLLFIKILVEEEIFSIHVREPITLSGRTTIKILALIPCL